MYVYYVRDDGTGLFLIARMKLGAPVPTCVWGNRRADAMTFENAVKARRAAVEIGDNTSAYRYNCKNHTEVRLKRGGDNERPTTGRAEGERTGCTARNPWSVTDEDRGWKR